MYHHHVGLLGYYKQRRIKVGIHLSGLVIKLVFIVEAERGGLAGLSKSLRTPSRRVVGGVLAKLTMPTG